MLGEMKKFARTLWIPVILDDTLKEVEKILEEKKPERILEIGTAIGYSSSCFSKYLKKGGEIDTIEIDDQMIMLAKANITMLSLEKVVNIIKGDALKILPTLEEKYDFIFMDGPKSHYIEYLPFCLKLLKQDGIIVADNVIYKGMVTGNYTMHKQRTAVNKLREFIETVINDSNLKSRLLDIGDGVLIIEKVCDKN